MLFVRAQIDQRELTGIQVPGAPDCRDDVVHRTEHQVACGPSLDRRYADAANAPGAQVVELIDMQMGGPLFCKDLPVRYAAANLAILDSPSGQGFADSFHDTPDDSGSFHGLIRRRMDDHQAVAAELCADFGIRGNVFHDGERWASISAAQTV